MKNLKTVLVFLVLAILFISCADVVTVTEIAEVDPHIYGFWGGTWHGWIAPFAFIGSLFSDDIAVYAIANNGTWYDFGFVGGFLFIVKIFSGLTNS